MLIKMSISFKHAKLASRKLVKIMTLLNDDVNLSKQIATVYLELIDKYLSIDHQQSDNLDHSKKRRNKESSQDEDSSTNTKEKQQFKENNLTNDENNLNIEMVDLNIEPDT
jgi:arginine/lysine/ornithine decarboxylase